MNNKIKLRDRKYWWKNSDDERFWIYLASFIDADGSILIYKSKRKDARDALRPCIAISNTNKKIIGSFMETIPKKIYHTVKGYKRKPQYKTEYMIKIENFQSVKFVLKKIKNYLMIKKQNAIILLKFIKIRESKLTKNNGYRKLNKEEYNLYDKIKKLNKKGVEI